MTKEEYREYLKDIVRMALIAEEDVAKPAVKRRLKAHQSMNYHEYHGIIADEILKKTPKSMYMTKEDILKKSLDYWHKILDSQGINPVVFVDYIEYINKD